MRFCPLNHKNKQTIIAKDNFNARYISVLSHWRTFETILTTESNVKLLMIGPPEQDGWGVGEGAEGASTKNVHDYQQAKSRAS